MNQLNRNAILSKLKEYGRSEQGIKQMDEYILWCIENNKGITDAGSPICTKNKMCFLAEKLIQCIKSCAEQHTLAPSVLKHFDSLVYDVPTRVTGTRRTYSVKIRFEDDLSRPSLGIVMRSGNGWVATGARTGSGVDDIISLFNEGYDEIKTPVYGMWDSKHKVVSATLSREPMHFIEQGIDEFIITYGQAYNIDVSIRSLDE